ncbi:MAG: rod shape-determining protein RodA [Oligoflexia bacterium]|nr:rod shape-determining protein RodA [Oligoflexia bacterium]
MALQVQERTTLKKVDYNFALVIFALHIIGLINLYSATHGPNSKGMATLFVSQIIYIIVGWVIFAALTLIDYKIFVKLAYPLYVLNVIMLVVVMFFGHTSLGAQRWINLGFFKYQPSETMKLVMVFLIAKLFHTHVKPQGHSFKDLIIPTILVSIPAFLVIKQPDLGTGLLLVGAIATMFLFVKVKRNVLVTAVIGILIALPVAWKFALRDYQKNRIHTFLDASLDPRGAGYNSIQSKIAVGSGKFFGKGFRKGTQGQLEFLPERHTDFIFSVLSEEHGFVGSITTLILYIILLMMGIRTASQAKDKFGVLLTVGIMSILFLHVFINIGMTTGILPIVGIPLPLISYGGSNMLTTMFALGIVSSVNLRKFLF